MGSPLPRRPSSLCMSLLSPCSALAPDVGRSFAGQTRQLPSRPAQLTTYAQVTTTSKPARGRHRFLSSTTVVHLVLRHPESLVTVWHGQIMANNLNGRVSVSALSTIMQMAVLECRHGARIPKALMYITLAPRPRNICISPLSDFNLLRAFVISIRESKAITISASNSPPRAVPFSSPSHILGHFTQ